MLLFVYAITRKGSSIKHTTALSQSNCRNFSCSSIKTMIVFRAVFTWLSKGIGFGFGFTTPFGWLVYLLWFWFYDSQVKTALLYKLRKSLHKSYKSCSKIPKQLRLKSPLHESQRLCFEIKASKVARNCPPQSHLSLACRTEIPFCCYYLTLLAGYLTNGPLAGNGFGLFLKQVKSSQVNFYLNLHRITINTN